MRPRSSSFRSSASWRPARILAFSARGNAATEGNATELPFNFDANFGFLALLGQNGTIVDRVDMVAQAHDTSRGRSPDGSGTIATFGPPSSLPTPGASNMSRRPMCSPW